jgi:hypothetical protein
MTNQHLTDSNKALVRSFYEGGTDSEAKEYGEIFHPDFKVTAPDYFPWGGTSDLKAYLSDVLEQVTAVLDFSRCRVVSLVGENDLIVIVIDIGIKGTEYSVQISEHWMLKDGKAIDLWVAYFEPKILLELIDKNAAAIGH